jgi:type II secretory pathway pseudopilin PulG
MSLLLLIYKKHRGGRKGFTLVELIIAALVGAAVMSGVVMVMSLGVRMIAANTANSAAQRGALSTVEMLSKEISAASKVEIISDAAAHNFTAGLADGWHYVERDPNRKEARHIYQEDDARLDEKIPGSEYIEALSFDTEVFKAELNGGGRLLRVNVEAAYDPDGIQKVELDRTLLVHAVSGVTGESDADTGDFLPPPSDGGHILRYLPEPLAWPLLDVYGSTGGGGADAFDYEKPDTWKNIKYFNPNTELDARLTLPPEFLEALDEAGGTGDDVVFTWIAADPTVFEAIVNDKGAKKNPRAILKYLEEHVPDYLEEKAGWELLRDKSGDFGHDDDDDLIVPNELIEDPFNIKNPAEDSRGFQLMSVLEGKKTGEEGEGVFDLALTSVGVDERKFSLNLLYDYYRGAYMIVVAGFPDGKGNLKRWPVYVKLGDYKEDKLYENFFTQVKEIEMGSPNTNLSGRMYLNASSRYGALKLETDENNRRYFEVTGNIGGGSTPAPLVMLKFTPDDFAHIIPRGAQNKDDVLYGVTNYAIYVDAEVPNSGTGGFGVLLNGSAVQESNDKHDETTEYTSGGYVYQFDPGANGLVIRYFGYHRQKQYKYGQINGFQWGARPMYFYDAAKGKYPAPGSVDFFKTSAADLLTENFNENAGAGAADNINYRIPFSAAAKESPPARRSMFEFRGVQVGTKSFSPDTAGRNEEPYGGMRAASPYGVTQGPGYASSVYSPKHMQSWHNYSPQDIVDMLAPNANDDKRIGFRWDRSWHLHRIPSEAGAILQHPVWEQRHILKLTVLEVTRDITAGEVDEEWRYNIHHKNDAPLTEDTPKKLTPLTKNDVIHQAGDMFVRAELIQLKPGTTDWNNSRNYVYSKPVWYGKFKGDAWRGDDQSPFKKLGNAMQHIVADPEPELGDDQSYRRRGMRVRSWKESFLGWDYSKITSTNYRYAWRDFVNKHKETYDKKDPFLVKDDGKTKKFPPDFYETVYSAVEAGRVDAAKTKAAHSVWTPPLEIDLNADNKRPDEDTLPFDSGVRQVFQSGDPASDEAVASADTFGQYMKNDQYVEREMRVKSDGDVEYAYNGKYHTDIYGRLSILRPWRGDLPNQTTPIFGLYAIRGWDFGTSRMMDAAGNMRIYDSAGNTTKRFLSVVQGLQIPYLPKKLKVFSDEYDIIPRDLSPGGDKFRPDRDRVVGFRFWDNAVANVAASRTRLYDTWIGEGFSPREVRAILGLKTDDKKEIRGTYVGQEMEKAGFYVPLGEYE